MTTSIGRSAKAALRHWQDTIAATAPVQGAQGLPHCACRSPPCTPPIRSPPAHPARLILTLSLARDRRARHRPLRLCAGAAGHAGLPALVLFGGRLHEHHQRRRLPRRRAAGVPADPALRLVGRDPRRNAGLRGLARDLRDDREFRRAEPRPAASRASAPRPAFVAGGALAASDRAIAAGARELPAQPVLCRTRHSASSPPA